MINPDRNKNKNIKILKVDDQEDYEKSGFKSMMDNVEETKKQALESVPQIPREQIPSEKEVTRDPLSQTYHILLSSIASYAHEPQIFEIIGNRTFSYN
jgi:hypothetical protein